MRKFLLACFATAGLAIAALATPTAQAAPIAPAGLATVDQASPIEQVRLVCNRWGRCWRTGPRYYRPRVYGPRFGVYVGPRYRYGWRHRCYWRHGRRWC
jgi:hypothetical protein